MSLNCTHLTSMYVQLFLQLQYPSSLLFSLDATIFNKWGRTLFSKYCYQTRSSFYLWIWLSCFQLLLIPPRMWRIRFFIRYCFLSYRVWVLLYALLFQPGDFSIMNFSLDLHRGCVLHSVVKRWVRPVQLEDCWYLMPNQDALLYPEWARTFWMLITIFLEMDNRTWDFRGLIICNVSCVFVFSTLLHGWFLELRFLACLQLEGARCSSSIWYFSMLSFGVGFAQ